MDREWKVGDEVAREDGLYGVSIHRVEAITPAGFLKMRTRRISGGDAAASREEKR